VKILTALPESRGLFLFPATHTVHKRYILGPRYWLDCSTVCFILFQVIVIASFARKVLDHLETDIAQVA